MRHPHRLLMRNTELNFSVDFLADNWIVDLKNGEGKVEQGKAKKANCTITISDEDFVALADGKLNPQQVCTLSIAMPTPLSRSVCLRPALVHSDFPNCSLCCLLFPCMYLLLAG